MAIVQASLPLNARRISHAVCVYFDWLHQIIIPNCYYAGGEMDVMVVSSAGFVTEIEIKTSLQDWQNDKNKSKWTSPERDKVNRFFYAVPHDLVGKCPNWVPESAGILAISPGGVVTVWRKAQKVNQNKISDDDLKAIMRKVYCRYWAIRMKILNKAADSDVE